MTPAPPRPCLRDPIPEIAEAARYLDEAVSAHLDGRTEEASALFLRADTAVIREWTESIWGRKPAIVGDRSSSDGLIALPGEPRMPGATIRRQLIERDGYHCRFCGIPVIRRETRDAIRKCYPNEVKWGSRNIDQHAALQAMWLQFDHLLPHSRGGRSDVENMVVTCAPCNFGRGELLLEEVGLIDPRTRAPHRSAWDGLERLHRSRAKP